MGLEYTPSSPTIVIPPHRARMFLHHFMDDDDDYSTPPPETPMVVDQPPTPEQSPTRKFAPKLPTPPPSLNYLAQSDHSLIGRKRSRADIGDDHEAELEALAGPVQLPTPKVEPRLGPGMTLVYDEPDLNISPESQSGTWMEEKAVIDAAALAAAEVDRPRLPARKSHRRAVEDEQIQDTTTNVIDPIVLRLGIGWKRTDEDLSASVAGDEAFIRNQYPYVQSPKILLHHEGLAIYVVRSDPIDCRGTTHQWWLFNEDLKSCRLLCNATEDDVLRRLANKIQDERGNWVPNILADGQIIYAKDSVLPLTAAHQSLEVMEVDA